MRKLPLLWCAAGVATLIVLGAAAPLLWWAARRSWRQAGVRLASAACLSVALWWAAERAFA